MHLTILGRKIKVKVVPQHKIEKLSGAEYTVGLYDSNNRVIYIAEELSEKDKRYYLVHESVHALHHFTGIDQTLPESLVEVICQSTASLFEDLMKK